MIAYFAAEISIQNTHISFFFVTTYIAFKFIFDKKQNYAD